MYTKILVPLDGSKRAERVLSHVEKLALSFGAKLILIRAVRPSPLVGHDSSDLVQFQKNMDEIYRDAENYLNALKRKYSKMGIEARTRVTMGPVVKEILDFAEKEKADLIALSSHGRSGLSRLFYGSVAAGILQRVDRPLLVIRTQE